MRGTVQLTLTIDQAAAISEACEVLTRLGIGQIEYVAEMVRFGVIRPHSEAAEPDTKFNAGRSQAVTDLCDAIKRQLRMPVNGSRGIGHPHNPMQVRRAYEVKKVIDKTLAEHCDPNPSFRTVNYDGLGPRYTSDPAPQAVVLPPPPPPPQRGRSAMTDRPQGWRGDCFRTRMAAFDAAYAKACGSSQPDDWMEAALLAQQFRNVAYAVLTGEAPKQLHPLPFSMDRRAQEAVLADLPASVAQEAGEFYENAGAGSKTPLKKRDAMAVAWQSVLRPYLIGLRDHAEPQARPQVAVPAPSLSAGESGR